MIIANITHGLAMKMKMYLMSVSYSHRVKLSMTVMEVAILVKLKIVMKLQRLHQTPQQPQIYKQVRNS